MNMKSLLELDLFFLTIVLVRIIQGGSFFQLPSTCHKNLLINRALGGHDIGQVFFLS